MNKEIYRDMFEYEDIMEDREHQERKEAMATISGDDDIGDQEGELFY